MIKKTGRGFEQTCFQRRHTDGQQIHEKMLGITHHHGNVNQNHNEISFHANQNGYHQKREITSVVKDVEKREDLHTIGGNVHWCSPYRKQ